MFGAYGLEKKAVFSCREDRLGFLKFYVFCLVVYSVGRFGKTCGTGEVHRRIKPEIKIIFIVAVA